MCMNSTQPGACIFQGQGGMVLAFHQQLTSMPKDLGVAVKGFQLIDKLGRHLFRLQSTWLPSGLRLQQAVIATQHPKGRTADLLHQVPCVLRQSLPSSQRANDTSNVSVILQKSRHHSFVRVVLCVPGCVDETVVAAERVQQRSRQLQGNGLVTARVHVPVKVPIQEFVHVVEHRRAAVVNGPAPDMCPVLPHLHRESVGRLHDPISVRRGCHADGQKCVASIQLRGKENVDEGAFSSLQWPNKDDSQTLLFPNSSHHRRQPLLEFFDGHGQRFLAKAHVTTHVQEVAIC
mmetsp:Transcript_29953/g.79863  ORF Transcript_29953/g.79863 Transcript_29953/m.79863 type:complete len:290 (+) Transcript_29953:2119-2988(+)